MLGKKIEMRSAAGNVYVILGDPMTFAALKAACLGGLLACGMGMAAHAEYESAESLDGAVSNPFSTSPFAGVLTLSFGYDSNVPYISDLPPFWPAGAERDSTYVALQFSGGWTRSISEYTTVGIAGEISGVYYFNDQSAPFILAGASDPSDFSRYVIHPKFFLSHTIPLNNGRSLKLIPSYGFRYEEGPGIDSIGLEGHQLRFAAEYQLSRKTQLTGHVEYQNNDFGVVFPFNPTSNRDANYYEVGVAWRHKPVPSRAITLGAVYQNNDSKGTDWEYDGFKLYAEAEMHLGRAYFGTFGVSYSDRNYTTGFNYLVPFFMPAPRTDQQTVGISAAILKPLDSRRALQAVITHERVTANTPSFSGDKTTIEFSFVLSLP